MSKISRRPNREKRKAERKQGKKAQKTLLSGFNCEFRNALEHFQGAMDIIKKSDNKWGMAINKNYQSFFIISMAR